MISERLSTWPHVSRSSRVPAPQADVCRPACARWTDPSQGPRWTSGGRWSRLLEPDVMKNITIIIQHKCCYRSWRTLEQTSSSQDPRTPRPGYRACPDWTRPVNQSEVSITRRSSNQVSVLPCLDLGGTQGLGMPLTWSCYGAPGGCGNLAMIIFMKVQCLMIVL